LTLDQVRALDPAQWPVTPVDAIMTPAANLPLVAPNDPANRLLDLMQRRRAAEVPVVDGGRLVGLATQDDLEHFLALPAHPRRAGPPRPAPPVRRRPTRCADERPASAPRLEPASGAPRRRATRRANPHKRPGCRS